MQPVQDAVAYFAGYDKAMTMLPTYAMLEEKARTLGFLKVGLLPVEHITIARDGLAQWLGLGYHGEMQWMADHLDKRLDPGSLMPDTKSILCVALNYYPGAVAANQLKVARYAQGDDYHHVLKDKLKALLQWLQAFDDTIAGRPLVDSAPIMEKTLAVQAGIGWQGKHSNIITPEAGSWVFLGELLLNITFPDAPTPIPVRNFCGSCTRCITACPTQAITEPYVVDATRCISYWTIEYKGDTIPQPIAENMAGWIFGCDICQEVCPWNVKRQQPTQEPAFLPRPWNKAPRPEEILAISPERFKTRYRKSPVKRAKIHGLQRNVTAALQYQKPQSAPQDTK